MAALKGAVGKLGGIRYYEPRLGDCDDELFQRGDPWLDL